MKCEKCGMELNDSYSFCPNCGNTLNKQVSDSNTNENINNSTNDSYVNPFTQGYGFQDYDVQQQETDYTNNAQNKTLHENIAASDNNFDKKENKQEIKANMNDANSGQPEEKIVKKKIGAKKVILIVILASIVTIVSIVFLIIYFANKITGVIKDFDMPSITPDSRYDLNTPTSTPNNGYNLNTPTRTPNNGYNSNTPTSTPQNVNILNTPYSTANNIYNPSTPTGSSNSTNIVELSDHKLKIPNGLIIDSKLDPNAATLHDSEEKFYATISVEESNYKVLSEYTGLYKTTLMQSVIDMDAEISDGAKEIIDGKEFIIYEITFGSSKLLTAITELDSNEILIIAISSVNNDFNKDYLKKFAAITVQ